MGQRFFAQKFSCGASVTAEDEIIIQGDFTDDIIDVIQEKWPEVDDDSIDDLEEVKTLCTFTEKNHLTCNSSNLAKCTAHTHKHINVKSCFISILFTVYKTVDVATFLAF